MKKVLKKASKKPKTTKPVDVKPSARVWKGASELEAMLYPIELLDLDPENENVHTKEQVEDISVLLANHGQVENIQVYASDGGRFVVKGGEGRVRAAQILGWTHLACIDFKGTPAEAAALRLSLNKSVDGSHMDEARVASTIAILRAAIGSQDTVAALTAFSAGEQDDLAAKLEASAAATAATAEELAGAAGDAAPPEATPEEKPPKNVTHSYNMVFDTESQMKLWYDFLKGLKDRYPDEDTIAARVLRFTHDEAMGLSAPEAQIVLGPHGKEAFTVGFGAIADFAQFIDMTRRLRETYGGGGVEEDGPRIVQLFKAATGGQDEEEKDEEGSGPTASASTTEAAPEA